MTYLRLFDKLEETNNPFCQQKARFIISCLPVIIFSVSLENNAEDLLRIEIMGETSLVTPPISPQQ